MAADVSREHVSDFISDALSVDGERAVPGATAVLHLAGRL